MIRPTATKTIALGLALGLSFACSSTGGEVSEGAVTAEPVVPEGDLGLLVEDLLSGDPQARGRAIEDIARLGSAGHPAAEFLVQIVREDQPDLRALAAGALVKVEADPREAVPALVDGLEDEDETVSNACGAALGHFGSPAVAPLVDLLESDNVATRRNSAKALGSLDEDAGPALKALVRALGDEQAEVRAATARALGYVGYANETSNAVQPLVGALDDEDPVVRAAAAWGIGEHHDLARWAALPLVDALRDPEPLVRMHAAIALGKLGEHARQATMDLTSLVENDPDPEVRREATEALSLIREPGN